MKEFRRTLALISATLFVLSFAAFLISAFLGCYGNLIWAEPTSFIAFAIFLVAAGDMDNDTYLKNTNQDD